jgi:hypothetical protein
MGKQIRSLDIAPLTTNGLAATVVEDMVGIVTDVGCDRVDCVPHPKRLLGPSGIVQSVHSPPVALFSFNRPEATRRALEAIRCGKPDVLFLVCDGPRDARADDVELCGSVREVLNDIDWNCDVHRIYRSVNVGCAANLERGLDEVFEYVPEAIVLEDDCVADPSFFGYCAELLERYRGDKRIWYISGFSLDTPPDLFNGCSYGFSTIGAEWGWATWSDCWQAHRRSYSRVDGPGAAPVVIVPEESGGTSGQSSRSALSSGLRKYWKNAVEESITTGIMWDKLWGMSVALRGGYAITPSVNMIENIGFGPGATHNHERRVLPASKTINLPLIHPSPVAINFHVARELEFIALWVPVGRRARYWRNRIPPGRARSALLRVLSSAAAYEAWITYFRLRALVASRAKRVPYASTLSETVCLNKSMS